jgi:hypothetical protein
MVQLMVLVALVAAQVHSVELCNLEEMELLDKEMLAVQMQIRQPIHKAHTHQEVAVVLVQ